LLESASARAAAHLRHRGTSLIRNYGYRGTSRRRKYGYGELTMMLLESASAKAAARERTIAS